MPQSRISIESAVMMGKPCIKGTRVTVELILCKLGAGYTFADLLEAYPHLTEDDLRAALAFAADRIGHEWRTGFAALKRSLNSKPASGDRVGTISEDDKYGSDAA